MPQGSLTIERLCRLAGVSRAGYYRHWRRERAAGQETAVRDAIQRLALANGRHRGYRLHHLAAAARKAWWSTTSGCCA